MENTVLSRILKEAEDEGLHILYGQLRQGGEIKDEFKRAVNKTRLNAFSVSKSFVSAGAGIALEEGLISKDEKICDAFSEYVPKNASENLLDTKVEHLLTMTTGLAKPLFFEMCIRDSTVSYGFFYTDTCSGTKHSLGLKCSLDYCNECNGNLSYVHKDEDKASYDIYTRH